MEPLPTASAVRRQERDMEAINHRPRRLAAPLAAVAVVAVLIAVLVAAGIHSRTPRHGTSATTTTAAGHSGTGHRTTSTTAATTTTTAPPAVSAPQSASSQSARYTVAAASFSLNLMATGGECWVQAAGPGGNVLFSGVLSAGQSHTVAVSGPVTVVAGAPSAFAATVDGAPVSLPPGALAPFTLSFAPA
jgi:hypothetical protein